MQVNVEGSSRFEWAIRAFDAANADDPRKLGGEAAEVLYARRMTEWLSRLYPEASEALQLAARSQHIRRWEIPRATYPMDRAGYHRWRTTLYSFHGDVAAKILKEAGYPEEMIARVRSLLKKEKLKANPEAQALEDVICLVFLENYFAEFAEQHDEEKIIGILRRTWKKMSTVGQKAALGLELPERARELVGKALASDRQSGEPE
jgi:hypothetical protein